MHDDTDITPLPVGSLAPDFKLVDILSGEPYTLRDLRGEIVVLNFWSGECPWSRHFDAYFNERAPLWAQAGIWMLHISSNANEEPTDTEEAVEELGVEQPILDDPGNVVADAFGAQTTPHVFVIDPTGRVAYQGAIDDRSFRQREATVNYLDAALEALDAGRDPDPAETPAYGCTIVRDFGEG